jgi:hypothetical protein
MIFWNKIKDMICIPAAIGGFCGALMANASLTVSFIMGVIAGLSILCIQIYNANFNKDR